jgi:arylsulfatase A-like enzyme
MAERPNILFVFPDQMRPDWVGWETPAVRTPTLDALRSEGVAFENAVTPSPVCGPARSCLATGVEYDRSYVRNHHDHDLPLSVRTLYEHLRDDAGYHVLGTGKFDLQKYSNDQGPDGKNNLGANGFSDGVNVHGKNATPVEPSRGPYMGYLAEEGYAETYTEDHESRTSKGDTFPTPLPEEAYQDNWIGRQTERLLRDAPEDRPWFCQANFVNPHNPWDVTEEMHSWYRDPDVEFPAPVDPDGEFDAETHQEIRRNYAAMVENVDRWLGRLLDVLEERGERENTLVVFASDHGEMLGDRGMWYKRTPYRPSAGVPLVVAGPGVESRGVVDEPATTLDLHATFRDYAGIDTGDNDSETLRPYLEGRGDPREVVFSGVNYWRMAFDGRHKLVRGFDPELDHGERLSDFDTGDEELLEGALRDREPLLFDTTGEAGEHESVAGERPEAFDRLDAALAEMRTGRRA